MIRHKYAVKFKKEGHDREWFLCHEGKVLLFPTRAEADVCGPRIVEWQYRKFGPGNNSPIVLADGSTMDRVPIKKAVGVHTHEVDPNRMLGESFELMDVNISSLPMDVDEKC